ncbi:MarR family transcriptional regulator [Lactobacillus sp. DCY120]|uniref:MarR family transcriptional regulator n=1 Tax=Bombilactobacillus apium TaxID=2675299 RepID=A0A850R927_9LACO|nr:MarR family transcriptional regulator [Bombilactobacillus apium]NVY95906.1 MarR family transcriptional regulator [Bombilactobacillus apium]
MSLNQEFVVARKVFQLANALLATRNAHLKALNITTGQADALNFFYDFPQSSISDLKKFKHIQHQSAQMITQRLVQKGYVKLMSDPTDQRAKLIFLSDAGYKMCRQLQKNGSYTGEKILNNFSSAEKEKFIVLLGKAVANLKEERK